MKSPTYFVPFLILHVIEYLMLTSTCRYPSACYLQAGQVLYPTVGLQTPGEIIEANFGELPFMFDFEGMLSVSCYLVWNISLLGQHLSLFFLIVRRCSSKFVIQLKNFLLAMDKEHGNPIYTSMSLNRHCWLSFTCFCIISGWF